MQVNNDGFRKRLKQLLSEKDIKQKQLAILLNLSEPSVSAYFTGKSQPDFDTLIKISKILNTSVQYLITGEQIASSSLIEERAVLLEDPKLRAVYDKLIEIDPENLELAADHLDVILKNQDKRKK